MISEAEAHFWVSKRKSHPEWRGKSTMNVRSTILWVGGPDRIKGEKEESQQGVLVFSLSLFPGWPRGEHSSAAQTSCCEADWAVPSPLHHQNPLKLQAKVDPSSFKGFASGISATAATKVTSTVPVSGLACRTCAVHCEGHCLFSFSNKCDFQNKTIQWNNIRNMRSVKYFWHSIYRLFPPLRIQVKF